MKALARDGFREQRPVDEKGLLIEAPKPQELIAVEEQKYPDGRTCGERAQEAACSLDKIVGQ